MKRTLRLSAYAVAVAAGLFAHQRRVDQAVAATRTATRRRLVEHLRANPRGLTVLDFVSVSGIHTPEPLTIFGDNNSVFGSAFGTREDLVAP